MVQTTRDPTAEDILHRIREAVGDRLLLVIHFGSRSQGRTTTSSDFDFLVVVRDPVDWASEQSSLSQILSDIRPRVDFHVYGQTEFEEECHVPGTIAFPAMQHGIVLYENPGTGEAGRRSTVARFSPE